MNEWVNEWINDYVYMRTNNAIISNNQSKDLIALWCLHVKSKALTPVYMQFTLFLLFAKNCGYFLLPLFTYPTAQHKWWIQKEQSECYWVLF